MAVEFEAPPPAADLLIDGRPDWPRVDFDLECPRCGYNLRMLETPRCPECGLEFSWYDLLHAHFTTNRFLFEHQCRNRPVSSFLITAAKSFKPWRFWSEVSLHDRVRVRPLLVFIVLTLPSFFLFLHGSAWAAHAALSPQPPLSRYDAVIILRQVFEEFSPPSLVTNSSPLVVDWLFLGMFVGATGILLTLRETLARCRLRSTHVLRVVGYNVLPGAALSAAWIYAMLAAYACIAVAVGDAMPRPLPIWVPIVVYSVACVPFGTLIGYALRRYLRLPRAYMIGLTASFTGLLAAVAIPAGVLALFR